jgi:VWFA-related protein
VVQSSTNNLNRVATSIGDLSAGGRTAVWEAITLSLLQLQDVEGRKALVVFYDGDDEDEEFSYRTAFSLAKESGVPIYMIVMNNTAARTDGKGFRTRSFTGRLDRIARTGGGRVFYVPTDVDLEKIYAVISEELRSHYLITYSPEVETGGSVWRSIDVNVKGRGLHTRTLSGYDPIRP